MQVISQAVVGSKANQVILVTRYKNQILSSEYSASSLTAALLYKNTESTDQPNQKVEYILIYKFYDANCSNLNCIITCGSAVSLVLSAKHSVVSQLNLGICTYEL
jgi:hypothetical protein